ncbi:TonB-dependent receptor [Glacieibacterium megasporae]|uniref:TonB-dependent receptor n=1 Tax=Glacieibacterium megasporae TaxID=2835787 RepID=UPI001C1E03B3|nr:TonB-dependent receptor [Polymorphobacter megasporae]UAJ10528.1 TonB-dependent receptor [Polymorphobacter megasporae]
MMHRLLLLASVGPCACLLGAPAWSQELAPPSNTAVTPTMPGTPGPGRQQTPNSILRLDDAKPHGGSGQNDEIQDIVVTAQRRAENLQNVPIAITAITGNNLNASGISVTTDLIAVVPGLNYTTNAGVYAQAKLRGIGTGSNGPGIENPVATYIDGVYISSMSGALLALNDVEQVAVLKGPQGTLFGRNATGGLIQITTRSPEQKPTMDLSVGYGNLQTVTSSAYLSGGLAPGLTASVSGYYQNQDEGFGKNLYNGQDVFKARTIAGRGKLRWQPAVNTTIALSADYSKIEGPLDGLRPVAGTFNVLGQQFTGGPYDVSENVQPAARLEQYGYSATATQDLGRLQIQSITAYRDTLNRTNLDYDETPAPLTNVFIKQFNRQFSQEIQLQPLKKGGFQWIVGGFYFWARDGYDGTTTNGSTIPNGISQIQNSSQTVNSLAGFAQASFPVLRDTNLTAGLRYTTDLRKEEGRADLVLPIGPTVGTSLSTGRRRFSKVTYRLSVDHRFSPDLLVYASYNRGFKSGAFLLQDFPVDILRPETLDAYEVGVKSDLFDRHLRVNVSSFYYDYQNIQLQLLNRGILTAYNGSGARFYGVDGDVEARFFHGLTLTAGGSYLHNEYKDFQAFTATPVVPVFPPPVGRPNGGNVIGVSNVGGNRVQAAPNFTVDFGGNYRVDLGRGHMELNANVYHNGGWYAEADNRLRQRPYDLLNASIAYSPRDNGLTISVYGKNLTNKVYAAYLAETDIGYNVTQAPGRTYGVVLAYRY